MLVSHRLVGVVVVGIVEAVGVVEVIGVVGVVGVVEVDRGLLSLLKKINLQTC